MTNDNSQLEVHIVSLDDLTEDPNNARFHGPRNLDAIRDSLSQWGQVEPLLVNKSNMQIIGGHGRVSAMRELGWQTVQIVYQELDETQATGLGIALNKTAELAEWNPTILAESLKRLDANGFDLNTVGFNEDEVARMMGIVTFEDAPGHDNGSTPDGQQGDDPGGFTNEGGAGDDGYVAFQFGDYRGRVRQSLYNNFVENYKKTQNETGEVMLDDIIASWLGVNEATDDA